MKNTNLYDLPKKIAIFPLTGAVLFPGTQLPLNIFEPRYVQMIDDALASPGRLLGMIQPEKPNQPSSFSKERMDHLIFVKSKQMTLVSKLTPGSLRYQRSKDGFMFVQCFILGNLMQSCFTNINKYTYQNEF